MKIIEIDIKKGIFHVELNDLKVNTHSHPAVEIIKAKKGNFTLETDFGKYSDLTFAIIDANINHKLLTEQYEIEVLLIESNNTKLKDFLFNRGIKLKNGIFSSTEVTDRIQIMIDLYNFAVSQNLKLTSDKRVYDCIQIIENENLQYKELLATLSSRIFLSESRISHLFKENVGISIKKHLVWCRIKQALDILLNEETNLKEASIEASFTDQAHLSKSFKSAIGISPIKIFNSRTLQF